MLGYTGLENNVRTYNIVLQHTLHSAALQVLGEMQVKSLMKKRRVYEWQTRFLEGRATIAERRGSHCRRDTHRYIERWLLGMIPKV
jgi:hypothetical protein